MNQSLQPRPPSALPSSNIRARLVALIQALLLEDNRLENLVKASKFQSPFKPVLVNLVKQLPALLGPMLADMKEEDLRQGLEQVRDEFLPFLLEEPPAILCEAGREVENENPSS